MTLHCARRLAFSLFPLLAAAWLGLVGPASALTVLLVTENNGSLTTEESARRTTFQGWGHTVTTVWDAASQSAFNTAIASADLVYVSEESSATDTAYKLRLATIGVVVEDPQLDTEVGFATSDGATTSATEIDLVDPAYGTGLITIFGSSQPESYLQGTTATGYHNVGQAPSGEMALGTVEAGSPLANTYNGNSVAAGRRLRLPWGGGTFVWSSLNGTGLATVQSGLVWAGEKPLLLHWKCDESSGTSVADASTYSRTGTLAGTGSWVSAVRHRGLSLSGAGKVEVASLLGNPASFSVAAWVNVALLDSSGSEVVSLGDHSYLRVTSSTVTAGFYNGSGYTNLSYNATLEGNGWRHLAATFDEESDTFRLYLDGAQVATTTTTAKVSYAGLGTYTTVGAHGNASAGYGMNGVVDDVRVYNKALTAAEVHWLHGFTGHWKLDEVAGTSAADSSGTGNAGSYSGSYVLAKAGVHQYSVAFGDGTLDQISLPRDALNGATSVTVAFWVKTTNTGSQAIVSGAKASVDNEYLMFFQSSTQVAAHFHGSAYNWNIPTVADGKWHHFALVTMGETNTTTLYRDGISVGSQTAGPGATPFTIDQGGLIVAQEQDSVGGGFASNQRLIGDLDDLRIYNRALTPAEIVDLYGLMIHWKLDEASGVVIADASGAARDAAVANGSPTWVAAIRNTGVSFDGTADDAVSNSNFPPPTEGTVTFWFRSTGVPTARQKFFGLGGDWEMWQDPDGIIRCDLCGDGEVGGFKTVSSYSTSGAWYHIAAVYDADDDSYAIYINGQLEKSGVATVNLVAQAAAKLSLATRTGSTERFKGTIDDFRVYNRKLTQAEIYQVYGLVGWYKLDETSGAVATDSTGLGNNGAYVGNPTQAVTGNGNPAMGTAVQFTGTNYVQVPGLYDKTASVSISAWAKLDAADSGGAEIVSLGNCFALRLFNGTSGVRGFYYNGSTSLPLNINQIVASTGWHHYAVVMTESSSLKVYIDGNEAGTMALSGPISYTGQGANTRFASHGNGQTTVDFTGREDDVRIFNRALQPDEVYDLYHGGRISGIRILTWTETR